MAPALGDEAPSDALDGQVVRLREALAARDAEIGDLQEQIKARREADQRDFLIDNSDQLAAIVSAKNQVIQDLQAELQALRAGGQGQDLAQALDSAASSAAHLRRANDEVRALSERLAFAQGRIADLERGGPAERAAEPGAPEQVAAAPDASAQKELEDLRAELQEVTNELAAARCEAAALGRAEAEVEELTGQLARARGKLSELEQAPGSDPAAQSEARELRAALQQKDQQGLQLAAAVEQLSEALESKTTQLTAASKALAEAQAKKSVDRQEIDLQAARAEAQESRQQAEDMGKKVQRLEARLRAAEQEAFATNAAKPVDVDHAAVFGRSSGSKIGSAIAEILQDVELGDKAGVTLTDLGMSTSSRCLGPIDSMLQRLSALMTVRADARLAGFGVWAFCHVIYIVFCVHWVFRK